MSRNRAQGFKQSDKQQKINKYKHLTVRDEIHGDISFDELIRCVIDHPAFQRLRYIKQLGLAEFVFPCATHTRFQHSLGASYLAGQYFETAVRGWLNSPFDFESKTEKTKFFPGRTRTCVEAVAGKELSYLFWYRTVSLAGLLHDVGHGPWSHTFEYLDLPQDFSDILKQMEGPVGKYLVETVRTKKRLMHEELSVLYIFQILKDLKESGTVPEALDYFLPVTLLVHRKMASGKFQKELNSVLENHLRSLGVLGGVDMHRLLRPMISGPFDVDRIDYIQRDGRNCGVNIGGIEWRRIVTKLIPCLAEHQGKANEPDDVVLISNVKNQHVLDDFIFSLFQMYAQVYMHPKIVGVEEIAKRLLKKPRASKKKLVVTFPLHQSLTDEKFRTLLKDEFGVGEIEDILFRKPGASVNVVALPPDSGVQKELVKSGYSLIDTLDRPMMKDSVGIFLFSSYKTASGKGLGREYLVRPWVKVSPIAHHFYSINYSPTIWVRSGLSDK